MYNNQNSERKSGGNPPPMSPRISFSSDFAVVDRSAASSYRDAPVSSDFEFSVNDLPMMSADQLFFKGRLLPLKEEESSGSQRTTLRDELRNEEGDSGDRPAKNPARWRGFLGLRKSHIGSKKPENRQQ
ncbi:hypothetical protein M569_12472, partial [Genlisea aurea]